MTFAQRLEKTAAHVDARLDVLLGEKGGDAGTIETNPAGAQPDRLRPDRLLQAMRHAALGGGKRIRPFLVIESAALFGLGAEAALDAAAAIECMHCYSLAHDDLPAMDNDSVRRGRPTVWKAYDEWTAILAGDALQTFAFEILCRSSTHPDASIRADLILALAQASGARGMAGGQALDLAAEKLEDPGVLDAPAISRLQAMKTGALITCACEMGAILGRANIDERTALKAYGDAIGRAFQIADDLLDAEGDAQTVGKAVAKDAAQGKATLVSLLGIEAARRTLGKIEAEAIKALAMFGTKAAVLKETAAFVVCRKA